MLPRRAGASDIKEIWKRRTEPPRQKATREIPSARKSPKGARPYRDTQADRPSVHRPGGKPRFSTSAPRAAKPFVAEPEKGRCRAAAIADQSPTVVVTADENNMRVDRFLETRFPGLWFSHIQRIVRKGELRVNGKRADSKDRLEEGQSVRIPPLRLDAPKAVGAHSEAQTKTLPGAQET